MNTRQKAFQRVCKQNCKCHKESQSCLRKEIVGFGHKRVPRTNRRVILAEIKEQGNSQGRMDKVSELEI